MRQREHLDEATVACWVTFSGEAIRLPIQIAALQIAFDRNWVRAYPLLGGYKLFTGSIEETIPLAEQAIRLSPRDPVIGVWYMRIGQVHLLQSRIDEAVIWVEKARRAVPAHAEARRLSGEDRFSSLARLNATWHYGVPKIRALFETTFIKGLRLAGMPEE
jgi:adenylate cyclase